MLFCYFIYVVHTNAVKIVYVDFRVKSYIQTLFILWLSLVTLFWISAIFLGL